ncbi:hypothetical protein NQ176_g2235 [Zarea fungicola]|uniref:Uncharacterized protein n=1 Tax=Zarea fungicola TaxID=93591 RepID=A0ACC1NRI9_9HYPO|nr:hypothetical protein NQ176_g2235 [Lecanicillium fungicola]
MVNALQIVLHAAAVSAAAIQSCGAAKPSSSFKLVAELVVNSQVKPLSVHGTEIGFTATQSCAANLSLVAAGQGHVFYNTGSSTETTQLPSHSAAGITVVPGGTATIPAIKAVTVECGHGTTEVVVNDQGYLHFGQNQSGWMACPNYESASTLTLMYRADGQRRLDYCAEIKLRAVCCDGDSVSGSVATHCSPQ